MVSKYSSVTTLNYNLFDELTIEGKEYVPTATLKGAYIVVKDNQYTHFERIEGESSLEMKMRMEENHVRKATIEEIYHLAASGLKQGNLTQAQRNKILMVVSIIEREGYSKYCESHIPRRVQWSGSYKKITNGLKLLDELLQQHIISKDSALRIGAIFERSKKHDRIKQKHTDNDVFAIAEILHKTISLYSSFCLQPRRHGVLRSNPTESKPYQIVLRVLLEAEAQGLKEAHAVTELMLSMMPKDKLRADADGLMLEAVRNDNLPIFEELMRRGIKLTDEILPPAVEHSSIETLEAIVTHVKNAGLHKSFSVDFQKGLLDIATRSLDTQYALAFARFQLLIDQGIIDVDQVNISKYMFWDNSNWNFLLLPYLAKLGVDLVFELTNSVAAVFKNSNLLPNLDQLLKYVEMLGILGVSPLDPALTEEVIMELDKKYPGLSNRLFEALERGRQIRKEVYAQAVSAIGLETRSTGKIVMEYLFGGDDVNVNNMLPGAMEYYPEKLSSGKPEANQKSFKHAVGDAELTRMAIVAKFRLA